MNIKDLTDDIFPDVFAVTTEEKEHLIKVTVKYKSMTITSYISKTNTINILKAELLDLKDMIDEHIHELQ